MECFFFRAERRKKARGNCGAGGQMEVIPLINYVRKSLSSLCLRFAQRYTLMLIMDIKFLVQHLI